MRLKAEEFAQLVESQKNTQSSSSGTLLQCVADAQQLLPNKEITLIVTGMQTYMK